MNNYEVIVGNIGTVYTGPSKVEAMENYQAYKIQSKADQKQEYGYVYYSPKGFEKYGEYGHPKIRLFMIERYAEDKNKIFLGREICSITSQVDTRNHGPYAFRVTTNPFERGGKIACNLINRLISKRWTRDNPVRLIIKEIKKMKAKRLISTGWIGDKTGHEWILYSDRMKFIKGGA